MKKLLFILFFIPVLAFAQIDTNSVVRPTPTTSFTPQFRQYGVGTLRQIWAAPDLRLYSAAELNLLNKKALNVDIPISIAAWGDSFTEGSGGLGNTYPLYLNGLSGKYVYNGGVGGETSTEIKDRFLADTLKQRWPVIIWAGRNNFADTAQISSDITAMINSLGHDRYLVLSVMTNQTQIAGTADHTLITTYNNTLAAKYGDNYIDVRSYIVSQYNPALSQDVIDHDNDVTPTSLCADGLHLNAAGYQKVAQRIYQDLDVLVPSYVGTSLLTVNNLSTLWTNPRIKGRIVTDSKTDLNTWLGVGSGNSNDADLYAFTGVNNTAIGHRAMYLNTSGYNNTGLGREALYSNTIGTNLTANGYRTLYSNTTGTNNTAFGAQSMYTNTTGFSNAAFGLQSLFLNTTGFANAAFGMHALYSNTTGTGLVASGYKSLFSNTSGNNNTAVGYQTLYTNTTGLNNTGIGFQSLYFNTASNNTGIGRESLYSNTSGSNLSATGYQSLYSNTTGLNNTAYGYQSMYTNTTGFGNTGIGLQSLYLNTTGFGNAAFGFRALYSNTTATNNTAVGNEALYSNTTGINNAATGYQALRLNTTGAANMANGLQALTANTTGTGGTGSGYRALYANTTGNYNTATGNASLYNNTTGTDNTANGYQAAFSNIAGSRNTVMGREAAYDLNGLAANDNTLIGYNTARGLKKGAKNTIIGANVNITDSLQSRYVYVADGAGRVAFASDSTGNVGLGGILTPKARAHIPAGTTTQAPIIITKGGVLLTTPVAGAIEATNTNLYFTDTISTVKTRRQIFHSGNTIPIANGGTGLTALGTANQSLRVNAGATALEYFTPAISLASSTGGIILTGGTSVRLPTLATVNKPNFNTVSAFDGLSVITNTTGSTNYPSTSGGGLAYQKTGSTAIGSFDIWKDNTATDELYFRTGSGTSTFNPIGIIASRAWVAASYATASSLPVQLKDFYTTAANSGTTETDLYSYTTLANRLTNNGDKLVARYGGNFNSGTSVVVSAYFGGTKIIDRDGLVGTDVNWSLDILIIRTGTTTARAVCTFNGGDGYLVTTTLLTGLDFTTTNILKITGEDAGGGTDSVVANLGTIEFKPAAL